MGAGGQSCFSQRLQGLRWLILAAGCQQHLLGCHNDGLEPGWPCCAANWCVDAACGWLRVCALVSTHSHVCDFF